MRGNHVPPDPGRNTREKPMNARRILRPLFASVLLALLVAPAHATTWSVDFTVPGNKVFVAANVAVEPGSEMAARTADGLLRRSVLDRSAVSGLGGAFAPGDLLSFVFFDGVERTFRVEERFPSRLTRRVLSLSEPAAGPERVGTVSVEGDGFTLLVEDPATGYVTRVFDGPDGSVVVEEINPHAQPTDPCATVVPDLAAEPEHDRADADGSDPPVAENVAESSSTIDVMVVFDASAQTYAASNGGITNIAETAVAKMNTALANTDLDSYYRFRLVEVMTVSKNYPELNSGTSGINSSNLSSVRSDSEITARRTACGADTVSVLMDTGSAYGTTGLGYSLDSLSAGSFSAWPFNICAIRSVVNSHTMTHETGHNMGAGHSNASGASSPGPQIASAPYSSGYHFTAANGTRYHTIMAYNTLNGDFYTPTACFSSPLLTFGGSPAGTAASNDNRRVLLQTYPYAVKWKTQVYPVEDEVFLSHANGTLFDGSLSVTVTAGSPSATVRYTLDGSAPTASSPLYSGPITITGTTTVKAVAFLNGTPGYVASATYYSIPEVLGVRGVSWSMSGDLDWVWDSGETAARSGPISGNQITTLSATMTGPGTFSFRWKADSEGGNWDYLSYEASWDSSATATIGGTGLDWALVTLEVPEGSQTVSWTYRKDMSMNSGSDCGWIKDLVWAPDASLPEGVVSVGTPTFTSNTATVNVTSMGDDSTSVGIVLEYSTSSSFGTKQTVDLGTRTSAGTKSTTLSGLSDGTTYYVRAVLTASPSGRSVTTPVATFATRAYTAPVLSAISADGSSGSPVPVSVTLSSLGDGSSSVGIVVQASTSSDFDAIAASATATGVTATGARSFSLAGLGAGATYYVRAVATGSNGKSAESETITVKVTDPSAPAGSFSLGMPARVSIPVAWSMTSLGTGNSSATVYLDYGTTSAFGSSLTVGTFNATKSNQSATISGLQPNTTYYVRLRIVSGTKTFATDPATATTMPVGDPAATVTATETMSRGATLAVSVTSLGAAATSATVTLEYGTSTSYGSTATVSPATLTAAGTATASLSGLQSNTKYYVRATVKNNGNKSVQPTTTFTTLQPNDPVLGEPSATTSYTSASVSVPVTMLGNNAAWANGTVRYGTTTACSMGSVAIARFTQPGTVSASITGLAQDTTYYYEITIVNSATGQTTVSGSFRTKAVATLAWGEGYYEPGLLQGYKSGNGALTPAGETIASGGYAASLARGPIASYAHMSETFENEVDGATYSWANQRAFVYEGQMWMEGGVAYQFAGLFYPGEYLYVDGEEILVAKDCQNYNAPYGLVVQSCTPASTGWHDVKIVEWSEWNGGGAGGGGTADWNMATKSPFYSIKYGLAWNTNGVTTVTDANVGQWKKLLDSGDRHLLRARGKQAECAFLDQTPTWTKNSLTVQVRIDSLVPGMTLAVYIGRRADAWYFEDRWERSATVLSVPDGASVQSVTFGGIDTSTDWYVSARLSDGSKYDQWTDPVKWTPVIPDFEKPTFSVEPTDGVAPMTFGGTASAPKLTITINNPSDTAVYAVYECDSLDGEFTRATSKQTRSGDLLSFEVDATAEAKFFQIKAAAKEADLP